MLARLREQTVLFLCDKTIGGAQGFCVTPLIRTLVAAQAAVPILVRGLGWYAGFKTVILYSSDFISPAEWEDEWGIVHQDNEPILGEAMPAGPVILSWQSIHNATHAGKALMPEDDLPPTNVVIHEFAHKIDMLNGDADGNPPLPPGLTPQIWRDTLMEAYHDFCAHGTKAPYRAIDPYAGESPAEFFAVLSELFFVAPDNMQSIYPKLFDLYKTFYGFSVLGGRDQ